MVIKTLVTIDWKFQFHRKWYQSLLQQLRVYINQTFSRLWRTPNPCTPFNCRHFSLTACHIFLWKLIPEPSIFINTSLISELIILALNQWFKTHNKRMFYSLFIGFFLGHTYLCISDGDLDLHSGFDTDGCLNDRQGNITKSYQRETTSTRVTTISSTVFNGR